MCFLSALLFNYESIKLFFQKAVLVCCQRLESKGSVRSMALGIRMENYFIMVSRNKEIVGNGIDMDLEGCKAIRSGSRMLKSCYNKQTWS